MGFPFLVALGALQAGGSLLSAGAADQAGKQQAKLSILNAELERNRQGLIDREGRRQERESRRLGRRLMATQRAEIGGSGFQFVGQPNQLVAETAARAELDALIIRENTANAVAQSKSQEIIDRAQARDSRSAGGLGAVTGLLGGGASLFRTFGGR